MDPWVWTIIWAVAFAVFLFIEFVSVEMISIWFAAGSLGGLILSCISVDPWIQVLTTILLSFVLLLSTRKVVKKWIATKKTDTNLDSIIGMKVKLILPITQSQRGTVKINDVVWNVVCDKPVESGRDVKIVSIDGNKLSVEEVI